MAMKVTCKKCSKEFISESNTVPESDKWRIRTNGIHSHKHPVSLGTHVAVIAIAHAVKHISEKKCVCPHCGVAHRGFHLAGSGVKNLWDKFKKGTWP